MTVHKKRDGLRYPYILMDFLKFRLVDELISKLISRLINRSIKLFLVDLFGYWLIGPLIGTD